MSPEDLTDAVNSMPPMETSDYHKAAAHICSQLDPDGVRVLENLIGDEDQATRGFNAFYVLLARHRRSLDASRYRNLYQRHASRFAAVPMRAVLESDLAMLDPTGPNLSAALRHATAALDAYPGNLALVAHRARMLAESGWSGVEVDPRELRDSLAQVGRAVEASPENARFRAVSAQLSALLGDFDTAAASIQRALDLEDSEQAGYAVRVVEYHRIRADIALRRETRAVRESLAESTEQLDASMKEQLARVSEEIRDREQKEIARLRSETLGSLGLLAAVIAFIVTSTQVAGDMPLREALRLLAGVAGMLALVFAAFGAAFGVGRPRRLLMPSVLGMILFALAYLPD
ncbi:hypothetical protein [Streptomyces sp. WMMB 714]|uniref:hypothetical protein n=1 Tax=Streptomyces sp. WMMB 714 TaxID=1286822 RepID=UPI000D14598D|nr:hypothetical protein [Streptomyces sp. WMMB 714]